MKKVVRLTENDLTRIIKRVISETKKNYNDEDFKHMMVKHMIDTYGWNLDTIKNVVRDIYIDEPEVLEELDHYDMDDCIGVITDWLNDMDFDVEEWFEEISDIYN